MENMGKIVASPSELRYSTFPWFMEINGLFLAQIHTSAGKISLIILNLSAILGDGP
jgi:hypothetical protein